MALSQITYNDKSNYQSSSLANEYKVSANDMNEIKSVVNSAIDNITGYELYNSSSGTTSTVTLSDSSANYNYIEIYFKNGDNIYSSTKVYAPNGKTASLNINTYNTSVSRYQFFFQNVTFSGASINRSQDYYVDIEGLHPLNYIYITRVVGYK